MDDAVFLVLVALLAIAVTLALAVGGRNPARDLPTRRPAEAVVGAGREARGTAHSEAGDVRAPG